MSVDPSPDAAADAAADAATGTAGAGAPRSVVVLAELALTPEDAVRLVAHHVSTAPGGPATEIGYRVLVPRDSGRSMLADVLDQIGLLDLRAALEAARGHDDAPQDPATAAAASVEALQAAGATATATIVDGDPVAALEDAVRAAVADEVVVLTRPHAVEDTFHTDWASKARARLGVPVLHVYAGSSHLG